MIGTIRRHQQWLWMVIITATIISFVYYFLPSNRNGGQGSSAPEGNYGSINGEPIAREKFLNAESEGRIMYRLNYGEWPDSMDKQKNLVQFANQRLLIDYELNAYHINVTPEAAARYTRQFLGLKPEDVVPADKILEKLTEFTREGRISLEDFDRFVRHQAGQEYLISLVGMSGKLITPKEAEVFFRRENEPMQMELVTFPAVNYAPVTNAPEAEISDFYTKRQADYRIPERVQVNYLAFSASNSLDKMEKLLSTNLAEHIDQEYLQAGPAAFKDESGKQLTPEAAKAKIRKQTLKYYALVDAAKSANAFLSELSQGHSEEHPYTINDLAALAKAKGLTVKTTEPFDSKTGPKEFPLPAKSLRLLFMLNDDDPDDKEHANLYLSSPVENEDAAFVIGLQKRYPSQIQPLAAVHDKVAADYRAVLGFEIATNAGKRFEDQLSMGLSQGKSFDTMCAAQFVRPLVLSPFSLGATNIPEIPDRVLFEQVMEVAARLHPVQCSPFIPTQQGGFVLYYKTALPMDESLMKSEFPVFLARRREQLQLAAFSAWLNKEYQTHFVPAPTGSPAAGG